MKNELMLSLILAEPKALSDIIFFSFFKNAMLPSGTINIINVF